MSGLTITQATRGLLDAFQGATEQGGEVALLVSEDGQDWTGDWIRGNTASGESRPDLLARDDGAAKFGVLCKWVRKVGGPYLRAAADLEAEVARGPAGEGEASTSVLSSAVLQSFADAMTAGGTPWCS